MSEGDNRKEGSENREADAILGAEHGTAYDKKRIQSFADIQQEIAVALSESAFQDGLTLFRPYDNSNTSSEFYVPYYQRYEHDAARILKALESKEVRNIVRKYIESKD